MQGCNASRHTQDICTWKGPCTLRKDTRLTDRVQARCRRRRLWRPCQALVQWQPVPWRARATSFLSDMIRVGILQVLVTSSEKRVFVRVAAREFLGQPYLKLAQ